MSWSVSKIIGKPEGVKACANEMFDRQAKNYEGKTEAKDVESARQAVNAWIDECKCTEQEGVCVEANGSRGDTWLNINVQCIKLPMRS